MILFFRSRYIVHHFGLHRTPDCLEIAKSEPFPLTLTLRPIHAEQKKPFYEDEDWIAVVSTEETISERRAAELQKDEKSSETVADIGRPALKRSYEFLRDFLKLVRWRVGVYGSHRLIRCSEGNEWSLDGQTWTRVRGGLIVHAGSELHATQFRESEFIEIRDLLLRGDREPIGHELLREAWNLRHDSPRSALVLGVSALEVGIKAFIAKLVPHSEWLCFEMPAPPVVRVLEEYLPKLPVKRTINGKVFVPEKIITNLKKAVFERNVASHKGAPVAGHERLAETLTDIQMTLYFLDYYAGHPWAIDNLLDAEINESVKKEFEARSPAS
jgi:hypothetical protein